VLTIIIAVPTLCAVTTPSTTVATVSSELVHANSLLVVLSGIIFAVNVTLSVALRVTAVLSNVKLSATVRSTVILHTALTLLPSVDFAVIFAVPTLCAVTTPLLDTLATLASELLQVTFLFVAVLGDTLAVNVKVSLAFNVAAVLLKVMPLTGVAATVTLHTALTLLPSDAVALMSAVPTLCAVTTPSTTVATVSSELLHVTVLLLAVEGDTVAVKV
jgi:hypothetical protein